MRIGVGLSTAADARAAAREVLEVVHDLARPDALVGCVAEAVVAGRREVEGEPAVVVWLAELPRPAETFHMQFLSTGSGGVFAGYRFDRAGDDLHLLFPDPYTFPTHLLFAHLNAHAPGTPVMGGLVSGAAEPGMTRLFLEGKVLESGAVGVRLPGLHARPVVSQGCRPIGDPFTVTGARGAVITELAGRPPLRLLDEIVAGLPLHHQALAARGILLGLAIDEYKAEYGRGDFLIRAVTGADPENGALEVGDLVEVGTTVQFHVGDAMTADEDLRESLLRTQGEGRPIGALMFTCNGRSMRMFDVPNHDAAIVSDLLGGVPVAGFLAAGELGPVGDKNFLHGFTASIALLVDH